MKLTSKIKVKQKDKAKINPLFLKALKLLSGAVEIVATDNQTVQKALQDAMA
jgi:hypothetical protein